MPREPDRPAASQTTAAYSFWGPAEELKKGSPVEESETGELAGHVYCRTGRLFGHPCFLRLTDRRLTLVVHYALRPDRLITIPTGALLEVALVGNWIRLRYRSETGDDAVALRSCGVPGAYEPDGEDCEGDGEEVGVDTQDLVEVLANWLDGHRAE